MSTATHTKEASALSTIDSMLKSIDAATPTKTAAEANTEAGGYQGATEHQVKNEDDHTEEAREGSRSSENKEDVKDDQGETAVDGKDVNSSAQKAALGLPAKQDDVQMDIGVTSKSTGEDSENETNRAKPGKEDSDSGTGGSQGRGQTSHPARTDNDQIDGHKWSTPIKNVLSLIKVAETAGNDALAAISVEADDAIKKQAATARAALGGEKRAGTCDECKCDPCKCPGKEGSAQAAGAAAVSGEVPANDKQAQAAQVVGDVHETIVAAYKAADMTASYIQGLVKASMGEEDAGEEGVPGTNPPAEGEEGGEAPPEEMGAEGMEGGGMEGGGMEGGGLEGLGGGGGPEMGGGGGGEEAALLEALTGGGGGGGGMEGGPEMGGGGLEGLGGGGAPEMGGMPGMEGMGGGPEMGGGMPGMEGGGMPGMEGGGMPGMEGGGMPGMEGGGMPGMGGAPGGGAGGQIDPQILELLAAALQQAQVSPKAVEASALAKVAKALQEKQASGEFVSTNWRPKNAAEAQRYQSVLNYINEIKQN